MLRRDFLRASLLVGVASLGPSTLSRAAEAQTGSSDESDRILFAELVEGRLQVISAAPDGTERRQLSSDSADSLHPIRLLSGDVAYVRIDDRSASIITMSADGMSRRVLAEVRGDLGIVDPVRSPDGKYITASVSGDLYRADLRSGEVRHLTASESAYDVSPSWSPDSRELAFVRMERGREDTLTASDIFIVGADGQSERPLTRNGNAASPAFSPTGEWVAWDDQRSVRLTAPDAAEERLLGEGGLGSGWSPDGLSVAFGRGSALRVADVASGSVVDVLEQRYGTVEAPMWDVAGEHITFATTELFTPPRINRCRADGSAAMVIAVAARDADDR